LATTPPRAILTKHGPGPGTASLHGTHGDIVDIKNVRATRGRPEVTDEMNAITLLTDDHRKVEALFEQYRSEANLLSRRRVVERIITELSLHSDAEEQHFYPAAAGATPGASSLVEESVGEHAALRRSVERLAGLHPEDAAYHGAVEELERLVAAHVDEEEGELFPMVAGALGSDRLERIGEAIDDLKRSAALPR
jgi:hemerythrin superfamily protein